MSRKLQIKLESLIACLLLFYLLVDTVNGVLIRAGFFSISVLYKATIILLIVYIYKHRVQIYLPLYVLFIYFIVHMAISSNLSQTIQGLGWLFKTLSLFWFYFFFKEQVKNDNSGTIFKLAKYSFIILNLNMVIGVLGYGFSQYTGGIGVKGLIYAGNEIGLTIVVSSLILLVNALSNNKYKQYLIILSIFLIVSILTTTKATLFAFALITVFFPLIKISNRPHFRFINKKDFALTVLTYGVFPAILIFAINYVLFSMGLWDRISFFYYSLGHSIFSIVLSGRDLLASLAFNEFLNYNPIEFLFGSGLSWTHIFDIPGKTGVEIDIVDYLMRYGIIGVLIPYGFLFAIILIAFKNRHTNPMYKYIVFSVLLIILISVTAGHVLYSGTAAPLLAALFALASYSPTTHQVIKYE